MHTRLLALACLVTVTTFAADAPKLPAIPDRPIAKKKELLFSDDFEKPEMGSAWKTPVGRWLYVRDRWAWYPGRRVDRPAWAPALVAWVGGSGWNVSVRGRHLQVAEHCPS